MGLDLQPDGLTAGFAGHCQPDCRTKISIVSERERLGKVSRLYPPNEGSLAEAEREKGMICMSASRETISHPQLQCCQNKVKGKPPARSLG